MKHYYVVTPPVLYQDIIVDGQGPWYEEPDVIEIEATSVKDAVALGVRAMLKSSSYHYCRDQKADKACPYTGVRALDAKTDLSKV